MLSTQTSQAAVAYSGKASTCFSVSIQAPGLGRTFCMAGLKLSATTGVAKPRPRPSITATRTHADCVMAKPIAAPMKGAVQGVAAIAASTPVKK